MKHLLIAGLLATSVVGTVLASPVRADDDDDRRPATGSRQGHRDDDRDNTPRPDTPRLAPPGVDVPGDRNHTGDWNNRPDRPDTPRPSHPDNNRPDRDDRNNRDDHDRNDRDNNHHGNWDDHHDNDWNRGNNRPPIVRPGNEYERPGNVYRPGNGYGGGYNRPGYNGGYNNGYGYGGGYDGGYDRPGSGYGHGNGYGNLETIANRIQSALRTDSQLRRYNIGTDTVGNTIQLEGTVRSSSDRQRAVDIARRIGGGIFINPARLQVRR